MGRLQDNQYTSFQPSFKKKKKETPVKKDRSKDEAKLQAAFCPPLDPSLIQAIWNDSFDFNASFDILTELAKEADKKLDQQDLAASLEHLDLDNSSITTTNITESEKDNFNFLMTCFPTIPLQNLVDALQSQNNDVEKATDVLLNREYLDQIERDGGIVLDYTKSKLNSKRKKKNNGDKKKLWSSGQLPTISATQGHTANPGAISNNMQRIMKKEEEMKAMEEYEGMATVPFNFWHQYDDKIHRLQPYFKHVPQVNIATCVQHCRGNIIASVKTLMEKFPNEKPQHEMTWTITKEWEQLKQELEAIMVDRTADEVSRVALGVIIDKLQLPEQQQEKKTMDQLVQTGIEHFLTFDVSQLELEARLKKMAEETEMIRAKAKKKEIPVIPDYLLINNEGNFEEDDPEECRNIAMELIMERNELFRKAAAAYRQAKNKGPGEGGIAFYYSDTARQLDSRARDWNMKAARATVREHRLKQKDDHLLDLHGLTVAEAQVVVREGLNQWYSRSQMQIARREFKPLKIITGAGKHSQYGEAKLLPTTLKILKKEGWLYDMPNPGCIYVKGVKK
ncbi:uncharacterized protein BX663DRAFT_519860 [Cokeromyces recurvatus]|uniref:uncharacterized protein n=1 Tax=Cokeromyces recurvatus TaxID=90255 RepID=UPI00221F5612|nr:uncharacterized protein BX663DRAFT_519860 [Cokeromyces recurvatus]KAI7899897.1 hypothetical protein BX663DRAFT_519860 [Cokeromyces recurvatus]